MTDFEYNERLKQHSPEIPFNTNITFQILNGIGCHIAIELRRFNLSVEIKLNLNRISIEFS